MSDTSESPALAAATEAGADFRAREQAIRSDTTLSADERGRQLGALEVERGQALRAAKVAVATDRADARAAAWVTAFGTQDPAGRRDADARAAELTSPQQAHALLAHADLLRDEELARAVGARALDAILANPVAARATNDPWRAVLEQYATARPDAAAALEQLVPNDLNPRRTALGERIALEARVGR